MSSEEAEQTYNELAEVLRGLGLSWILQEVEETASAGQAVEKPARIFSEEGEDSPRVGVNPDGRRRRKSTRMMSIEPFSAKARLELLIDAVRHAVVHAAEIESEEFQTLETTVGVRSIRFASEREHDQRPSLDLSRDAAISTKRIGEVLHAIQQEAAAE